MGNESLHHESILSLSVVTAPPTGECVRQIKSCLCCWFDFLRAWNVTGRTRAWFLTFQHWWKSGRVKTSQGHSAVTMVRNAAIYGMSDSHHLSGSKWFGTARPYIEPGSGAVTRTWHVWHDQRRPTLCEDECECGACERDQEQDCVCWSAIKKTAYGIWRLKISEDGLGWSSVRFGCWNFCESIKRYY